MIRVLIAAASAVSRAGLDSLLRSSPAIEVTGSVSERNSIARLIEEQQPDVVVAELTEAGDGWLDEFVRLAARAPASAAPALVALADNCEAVWSAEALSAGLRAVLPREIEAGELTAAVEAAAAGLAVIDPHHLDSLLAAAPANHGHSHEGSSASSTENGHPENSALAEPLTARESEVLGMLAEGLGNKEVAAQLGISEHTVKFHVASIMGKLSAASRTEAVTIGIRRGLILL